MTNAASAAVLTPNINLKRVLQVKIKSSPSARLPPFKILRVI